MKTKFKFSNILDARQTVEAIASDVARLEADVVVAERKVEEARRDDGVSAPEEIYNRSEAARREMGILKIEANRAAAKLAEAEEKFGDLIQSGVPTIIDHLDKVSNHKAEEIKKMVSPIFGESALNTSSLKSLISAHPDVAGPRTLALRIRLSLDLHARPRPDLITNVLSAEEYL